MRFEFYTDNLENTPKLAVDGTVPNSIHFAHWEGNETADELKADTSTEIALNVGASPNSDSFTEGSALVTNNHFECDGVLSVWCDLDGVRAVLRNRYRGCTEGGDVN